MFNVQTNGKSKEFLSTKPLKKPVAESKPQVFGRVFQPFIATEVDVIF